MTDDDGALGRCPNCGRAIRPIDELVTYERSNGSVGIYAGCPGCGRVVAPE